MSRKLSFRVLVLDLIEKRLKEKPVKNDCLSNEILIFFNLTSLSHHTCFLINSGFCSNQAKTSHVNLT